MACREVADSSSGSGFPMNDGEARAPSKSPERASYEDKPPCRKAFDIEGTMQRKRENNGGQEIPGTRMNKMTRMGGLPSPKKAPGYLAVGGPAFPAGISRAGAERNEEVERNPLWELLGRQHNPSETASTDIWGAFEAYDRLRTKRNGEEHTATWTMRAGWGDLTSDAEAPASMRPGAPASRWETSERQPHGGVSVEEFKQYLISTARSHASSSQGGNFRAQQIDTDETVRYPWGFCCRDNMCRRAALFNPWGSLNQEAMVTSSRAPASCSAPRGTTGPAPADLWAPSNQDINDVSVVPVVTPRVVGHRPQEPEVAPKKPLVLLTPDDFLTLTNTDITSMLEGVEGNKSDAGSVKSDRSSHKTKDEVSDDSENGSLIESDHRKDESSADEVGDEDGEYIHPMQVISDSIDKVDSWLQQHSEVLGAGVAAAARVVDDAPLFEMPADDEVVERCQDIKRREFESTLDLARRKLRANTIKFERVAARFEKLYNEHLLEKCWLAELEDMKGKMSMKPPVLNETKRDEAPAPADINAPGPSGLARK